ncbi:MAG: flavin-containing monooxygenase [Dehalococcoidia bacterium]
MISSEVKVEQFDTIIVGAGIAGITTAYYLNQERPDSNYVILEALDNFGGTWWSHKYPGIRSDSDLYTFGFKFKPWTSAPIATAEEILKYIGETIKENGIDNQIRYHHKITEAEWDSEKNQWLVKVEQSDTNEVKYFLCNFLMMCQGYYRHNEGYTPKWEGMDKYKGEIVHTEEWPEDLDYTGKKVIVIGSGATTATVVPAMASKAAHVTMLQRSPTYFRTQMNRVELADRLRKFSNDEEWIYGLVRQQILIDQEVFIRRCIDEPDIVKEELLNGAREILGPDFDIEKHFTPSYRPWQQRLALIPDGDLFRSIAAGDASVVTDEIEKFTENGILLKSGIEVDADIILTATGFNMSILGDIEFTIDGEKLNLANSITYRGMMFTDVPNLLWVFGYFRGAWTLRAELLAQFVSRLQTHMDDIGAQKVSIALRKEDQNMKLLPWISEESFNPGYIARAIDLMPKSGDKPEWVHNQNYWYEKDVIPAIDLNGEEFIYE